MKHIESSHSTFSPLKRGALFYLGFWGVMGMFAPFLNVYFRQVLGFSGRQIGFLSIFFPLMTLVIAMPVSHLADRRNWRVAILTFAVAGFGLSLLLGWFPQRFRVWGVLMCGLALFFGPIIPLADSLIARMAIRHDLNYGSMRLCGSLSFAITATICGILWEYTGFSAMFLLAGLSFFPVALLASGLEESTVSEQKKKPGLSEIRKDAGLVMLIIASFLVGASVHLSILFDGIYMNSLGGTQTLVGLMFGLSAFCELPTMQYSTRIARFISCPKTLLLGYSLLIMAFIGYTLVQQPVVLLCMAMVKGSGFGLFYVNTVRLTHERVSEDWAATVQSILTASAFGLAPLIASPLGGEIYDRLGVQSIYIFNTLCVTGALLIMSTSILRGIFTDKNCNPATALENQIT